MKKMLPIISTLVRSEHNPGDTFIGIGGQYLIERVFGPMNWMVINKFGSKAPWEAKLDLIKEAGIVFYAGMPQYNNYDDWCFWYDKEMWEDYIVPNNLDVISIAGGAGYPNAEWTPKDFTDHCMASEKTIDLLTKRKDRLSLTTVRDPHGHELLNTLGIENYYMPCSATFSTKYIGFKQEKEEGLTILVPPSHNSVPNIYIEPGENKEEIVRKTWLDIYKKMKNEYKNIKVVTHFYPEYLSLRDYIEPNDLYFTSDYISLLRIYTKAELVVSARLHGSLPAYGVPGTRVVNIAIDTRGHAAEIFPKIPTITYKNLSIDTLFEKIKEAVPSEESDFEPWLEKYDSLISNVDGLKSLIS